MRVEATFDPPARILTVEGVAGYPYLDDVTALQGDVTELRGDTMVMQFAIVAHPGATAKSPAVIIPRRGTAMVPMASTMTMRLNHIPSTREIDRWERMKLIWGTILTIALIALSLWINILLNPNHR